MPRPLEVITATEMIEMVAPLGLDLTDELPDSARPLDSIGPFIGPYRGFIHQTERLTGIDPFNEDGQMRTRKHVVGEGEESVSITVSVDPVLRDIEPSNPDTETSGRHHVVTIERAYVPDFKQLGPRGLFVSIAAMRAGLKGRESAFITSKSGYKNLETDEYTTEPNGWIFVGGETEPDQFPGLFDDPETLEHHQKRLWVGSQILRALDPNQFTEAPNPIRVAVVNL